MDRRIGFFLASIILLSILPTFVSATYSGVGYTYGGGADYWKVSNVVKGELFLLTIVGQWNNNWESQLSYSNLTVIETNNNMGTHITQFIANVTGDLLLRIRGNPTFQSDLSYTIECSHKTSQLSTFLGIGSVQGGADYWRISNVTKGDLFLLVVAGMWNGPWESQLSYSNLTVIETNNNYGTHITQFIATVTDDLILRVQGYTGYSIWSSHSIPTHNVAITEVLTDKNTVFIGDTIKVSAIIKNLGDFTEKLNITAYYGTTAIANIAVTDLISKEIRTIDFQWNTAEVPEGNYTISAQSTSVQFENNITDNNKIGGIIWIKSSATPTQNPTTQPTSAVSPTLTATPTNSPSNGASPTPNPNHSSESTSPTLTPIITQGSTPTPVSNSQNPTPTPIHNSSASPTPTKIVIQNQQTNNNNEIITLAIAIIIIGLLGGTYVGLRRKTNNKTTFPIIQPATVSDRNQKKIFIGYIAEDLKIVEQLVVELEKAGFKTWYYNRDNIAGSSYMETDAKAIKNSQGVIIVVSPDSIKSNQVTKEILYAHDLGKPFFPLLHGMTFEDLKSKKEEWKMSFGASTAIEIHGNDVVAIIPKLIEGLDNIDTKTK